MNRLKIPEKGMDRELLFKTLEAYRGHDADWRSGRVWGYVYHAGKEVEEVCKRAYTMFFTENGLDPTVYPSQMRMENDVIAMAASHLSAGKKAVGSFTSGGTESIILAVKTARDYSRAVRPVSGVPNMVLPATAHAAFYKAGELLGVKPLITPVNGSFKADVNAMDETIDENTILLVGSAPSYAHGVIDPIEKIGRLAKERDLLFHVDACIGGFLLPYFSKLGVDVPLFDFRVLGVSSISMDLHKYGYAAKGASVILYKDKELRKHQFFTCTGWPGYTVVNSTLQSTKSVGPLAAAWAVLNFLGNEGYLKIARDLLDASRKLAAGIVKIEGFRVLGDPLMTLIAFTSDTIDVFHVADEMKQRGWYVQVQLAFSGGKENLHLSVAPSSVDLVDELLADLEESVKVAGKMESGKLAAAVEQNLGKLDFSDLNEEIIGKITAMAGIKGATLPDRMAGINEILNTIAPQVCDYLLLQFFSDLYTPTMGSSTLSES